MNREEFTAALLLLGFSRYPGVLVDIMEKGPCHVRMRVSSRRVEVQYEDTASIWMSRDYDEAFFYIAEKEHG